MDLDLKDKVALITGGNKGLGAASARVLAREGARIFITARNESDLDAVAQELSVTAGADVGFIAADLVEADAADKVIQAVIAKFGRIDALVNCAGASQGGVFWEIPDSVWEESFALKFMATMRVIRAAIAPMRAQRYGRIVTVVGNTGKQPNSRMLPGAAANAALLAIIKGVADEVAGDGIAVNAVNPGPTRTERWKNMMLSLADAGNSDIESVEAEFMEKIPMNRLGEPEEIARIIAFLASPAAANMTGTSITADGGWTQSLA